jgi:hypothetical protein
VSHAQAVAPAVEASDWFLPHPGIAPWVLDFVDECASFPKGAYDDQVDAWSQGGIYMARRIIGPNIRFLDVDPAGDTGARRGAGVTCTKTKKARLPGGSACRFGAFSRGFSRFPEGLFLRAAHIPGGLFSPRSAQPSGNCASVRRWSAVVSLGAAQNGAA